jgi:phosphatidylglycerophosphatase A
VKRKISEAFLTFGFVGRLPGMPGTWGSAAAIGVCLLVPASPVYPWILLAAALVLFSVGSLAARDAERLFGRPDPGPIVLDEVVGVMVAAAMLPKPSLPLFAVVFVVFRLFDILKPFPVRHAERLPGGIGIFMDDVVAGLYTNAVVRLLLLVVS